MNEVVSILIPTWDNFQYLTGCLSSLIRNRANEGMFHVYVVNNGHPNSCDWVESPLVTVLQTGGENLGWEGGLKLGLEHAKGEFICFFNDDAYIPTTSKHWLQTMLQHFKDPKVAAVGPSSNVVMGMQNIFATVPIDVYYARFLIGFCMLVRRSALEKVGGVDDTLPGGDDLDLSIRFRDHGYKIVGDRTVFVYHHGFKTGERVHGTSDKTGGWNSYEFKEKTDFALIQKHGFRKWYECMMGVYKFDGELVDDVAIDIEGDKIRSLVQGEVVLDIGCGNNKTLPEAIGVDMIKKDAFIDTLTGSPVSQGDIQADVSKPLPLDEGSADTIIARHILEHMVDPISALRGWVKVLKPGANSLSRFLINPGI
jgi:GT2 family glycosyltransferase